ncbi:MAG: metallophosphoesterase [Streptococcaceae bacterium]|nr:metallophosphoesterase [Streptococcaceae bacterium]
MKKLKVLLGIIFLFVLKANLVQAAISDDEHTRLVEIARTIEIYGRNIHENGYIETNNNPFFNQVIASQADIHFVCDLYFREESNQPMLRSINVPREGAHVIGDVHGQLVPTIRQIKAALSDNAVALLTGDLKDRGRNSLEVMIYAYVQRLLNPDRVFILLGNHDWDWTAGVGPMIPYLRNKYVSTSVPVAKAIKKDLEKVMDCLPWAAELKKRDGLQKYFCAHGGIGPTLQNRFNVLQTLRAPVDLWRNHETNPHYHQLDDDMWQILTDLTWSDPHNGASFVPNRRGEGYYFNFINFQVFCATYNFTGMIAAHRHDPSNADQIHLTHLFNGLGDFGNSCPKKFYSTLGAPDIYGLGTSKAAFVLVNENFDIQAIDYDDPTIATRWPITPQLTIIHQTPPPLPAFTTSTLQTPPTQRPTTPSNRSRPVSQVPVIKPKQIQPALLPSIIEPVAESIVYRVYNPNSGMHHYTMDWNEVQCLVDLGWNYEQPAFNYGSGGVAVYRLYNPNDGTHHYTLNANERDSLVAIGWNDEGIAWYALVEGSIPIYRAYNPGNGEHFWTLNKEEVNAAVAGGWRDEGVAWCTR